MAVKKSAKKVRRASVPPASTAAEETRRIWLACLGALSLTRKHGGEWIDSANGQTRELALRGLQFARETLDDTRAHAIGAFAPLSAKIEKRLDAYVNLLQTGLERTLTTFGVPTKRELDELSRHIAVLNRRLKAAK